MWSLDTFVKETKSSDSSEVAKRRDRVIVAFVDEAAARVEAQKRKRHADDQLRSPVRQATLDKMVSSSRIIIIIIRIRIIINN